MKARSTGSQSRPSATGAERAWRLSKRLAEEVCMTSGKNGQPVVVVTGMGLITSLGAGKTDNWAKLIAGESGVHRITRFANEGPKTPVAGTVDCVPVEPFHRTELGEGMAAIVAEEPIDQAGMGSKGDFPGPLLRAVAPVEIEWLHRDALAVGSSINDAVGYNDLL